MRLSVPPRLLASTILLVHADTAGSATADAMPIMHRLAIRYISCSRRFVICSAPPAVIPLSTSEGDMLVQSEAISVTSGTRLVARLQSSRPVSITTTPPYRSLSTPLGIWFRP